MRKRATVATRTGRRFTRADLERIPEDAYGRHEIIDGVLVVSPSPSIRHARVVAKLFLALHAWAEPRGGLVLPGNVDLYFAEDQNLIPDVFLVLAEHLDRVEERYLRRPPDLVAEVSSPSTRRRDLSAKRRIYGEFAVPEYWFVDRDARELLAFRLGTGGKPEAAQRPEAGGTQPSGYGEPQRFAADDTITSPLLPGFAVRLADLLPPK